MANALMRKFCGSLSMPIKWLRQIIKRRDDDNTPFDSPFAIL